MSAGRSRAGARRCESVGTAATARPPAMPVLAMKGIAPFENGGQKYEKRRTPHEREEERDQRRRAGGGASSADQ